MRGRTATGLWQTLISQDLVFKLFFSGGHYSLPLHFEPRATRTINVSDITQNSAPDAEGNTIPPSIHEGSAKITGSHADNEIVLLAMDFGTYNVRKATCGGGCYTCDGYSQWEALLNPFGVGVGKQYTVSLTAAYDGGSRYNFGGTWNSNNTPVLTVGSSTGTATGVTPGSATVSGYVTNSQQAPVYVPQACSQGPNPCPVGFGGGGQSNGNVSPSVSFSSIPSLQIGQTATISATVNPSSNTVPISLSITSPAAKVSPTGTFTGNTTVTVKGISAGTATLTANVSNPDGGGSIAVGSTSFQVVPPPPSVSISLQTSGTGSSTNSALSEYQSITGTQSLGIRTSTQAGFKACFGGVQLKGAVSPSNYTGTLQLHRTLQSCGTYNKSSTSVSCTPVPRDDTSSPALRDDSPSTSGGSIYDLDTPGVENGSQANSVYRYRANFQEYATLSDGTTVVSTAPVNYYVRLSCKFDSGGNSSLDTTVSGDNQIGLGTTATSWNLQ